MNPGPAGDAGLCSGRSQTLLCIPELGSSCPWCCDSRPSLPERWHRPMASRELWLSGRGWPGAPPSTPVSPWLHNIIIS